MIVCFVDIVGHYCLNFLFIGFVDIGGLVDHPYLEVIDYFVDIGELLTITVQLYFQLFC